MMQSVAAYTRVSTGSQDSGLASQEAAINQYLINHGITNVTWYRDTVSGATLYRPQFDLMQRNLFMGQHKMIVCWKLDRISRSLQDGINVLCDWLDKDIQVVAVAQSFDLSGVTGKLIASVLYSIAEIERDNIREATRRGLQAARDRGMKLGGSEPKVKAEHVVPLLEAGMTMSAVARHLGRSRQCCYNALKREGIDLNQLRC